MHRGQPFYCNFDECDNRKFEQRSRFLRHFREVHDQYYAQDYESSEDDEVSLVDNMNFDDSELSNHEGSHFYNNDVEMDDFDFNPPDERFIDNIEEDFVEGNEEDDEFNFRAEVGEDFLTDFEGKPSDFETTKITVARFMNHCKSKSQIASSVCNRWISLGFRFASILHKHKRDAARHLNLAITVSKSNYLQQRYNNTRLGVVEHFNNGGVFYYIPIEYTLKAIFGVPGVAELIDNDYYCEYLRAHFLNFCIKILYN